MSTRSIILGGLLAALVVLDGGPAARAQPAADRAVLARFESARALAIDPTGRLYVADAGRDVVYVLDRQGAERAALGSPGTRAGEFDGPEGLDPTNGQALLVADAGNGRVQRFSAEWQYLEALPIGRSVGAPEQRVFDDGRVGADVQGDGRPVAVASTDGGDLYVLDERAGAVVTFDAQRRPDPIVGAAGELQEPVAIALDDGTLYVADAGRRAVFRYGRFGTFQGRLPLPDLPAPRALTVHRGRLWVVCADRIVVWDPATETRRVHRVPLPGPLVGAVGWKGTLFALTDRQLVRLPGWE